MVNNYQIVEKFQRLFILKFDVKKDGNSLSQSHQFFLQKSSFTKTIIVVICLFTTFFISGFLLNYFCNAQFYIET
jgi:uncharacterized membrane protein